MTLLDYFYYTVCEQNLAQHMGQSVEYNNNNRWYVEWIEIKENASLWGRNITVDVQLTTR